MRKYWSKSWPLILTLLITTVSYLAVFGFSSTSIDMQLHDTYFVLSPLAFVIPVAFILTVILVTVYQVVNGYKSYVSSLFMFLFLFWLIKNIYIFLGYKGAIIGHYRVTPSVDEPIYPYLYYFDYLLIFLVILFLLNLFMLLWNLRKKGFNEYFHVGKRRKA